MKNKIGIGISTMRNNRKQALDLARKILSCDSEECVSEVVIVSQAESGNEVIKFNSRLTLIKSTELGLSKSRNKLLIILSGEYLWLLDDDVSISKNLILNLSRHINSGKKIDILVGKIECSDTCDREFYKDYNKKRKGLLGLLRVSSIEFLIRSEFIKSKDLSYNENLGLGSKYPCGEENYFLIEAWNLGVCVKYFDETFVYHPCIIKKQNPLGYFATEEHIMAKVHIAKVLPLSYSILYVLKILFNLSVLKKDKKLTLFFILSVLKQGVDIR